MNSRYVRSFVIVLGYKREQVIQAVIMLPLVLTVLLQYLPSTVNNNANTWTHVLAALTDVQWSQKQYHCPWTTVFLKE